MEIEGVALVTGASRGIGRAVALELARKGFEVVATMRDVAAGASLPAEAAAAGGRLRVVRLDVERPDTIRMPDGLRVLVNNAGIEGQYLPVEEAPLALWRRIFETNVFGLVETTRRAIPVLRASGGGVICNVTSCAVLYPMPLYAAYRASKAAVAALGESLRLELRGFGIRIVEVMPGSIDTDMLAGSDRVPEAIAYPAYRALAERAYQGRKSVADVITPPDQASQAIVAAILDDDGPLRYGCDPLSTGMLAAWRHSSDEDWMRAMLDAFGTRVPAPGKEDAKKPT
jgi:NAD(P)-dependent dehydrogenase (short-subunit alcohol dehydrogenase family)